MKKKLLVFVELACVGMLGLLLWRPVPDAQVCEPTTPQKELLYLRRLSLDLRGQVPSVTELDQVAKAGKVPETLIDKMLNSQGMIHQLREYHRGLLWTNISNILLTNVAWRLSGNGTTRPLFIASQGRKRAYRGANVECLNEPVQRDAQGKITCKKSNFTESNGKVVEVCREGYVMIKPYWDPTTSLKVCAYGAQAALSGKNSAGNTLDCSTSTGSTACGCGPGLRWCQFGSRTRTTITSAMVEQTLRFVGELVKNKKPYSDVLVSRDMEVNGPLSHYLRYQVQTGGNILPALPKQGFTTPAIAYHENNKWVKVVRGNMHAGLLTMPAYLLKFASNRGRANRFYNAFMCNYFQAPQADKDGKGGIPPASDNCHEEPNLIKRCGCKHCHQTVEPMAAYWGRWAESGISPLLPSDFPKYSDACKSNRYSYQCRSQYFTRPNHFDEEKYRYYLKAYVFATPEMEKNIESGPKALATREINNGTFGRCTARKMWTWVTGHEPLPQQTKRIEEFATLFKEKNHDILALIKAIVMSQEYKEGRLLNK